jgi:hypothetical protein
MGTGSLPYVHSASELPNFNFIAAIFANLHDAKPYVLIDLTNVIALNVC